MAHPVADVPEQPLSVSHEIPSHEEKSARVGTEVLQHPARALMGWIYGAEAITLMLGHTPSPADNTKVQQQAVAAYKIAVAARTPFNGFDPIQEMGDQRLAASLVSRPDIQAAFAGLQWRPALVNLKEVLSFQKTVSIDGLKERIAPALHSNDALLDLCLPVEQQLPPQGAFKDQDQKGMTVSSLNPNLRVFDVQLHPARVNLNGGSIPTEMQAVTFIFSMGTSHLSVVRFQGRCFIRDGYHRSAGLLREGIEVVPCILVEARTFDEVGCPPGAFSYEVLFGQQPPRVADFWDDSVACDVSQPAIRKGIRFRGDEFVVPR